MIKLPYWRESFVSYTSFVRRGRDLLGAASSTAKPTTHFIVDCPKRKKLDFSSSKYDYTKRNDYSKADEKKKHHFGHNKKKKFQKIIS
jgi:hypothetical protein